MVAAVLPEAVEEFLAVDPACLFDVALGERIAALESLVRRAQAAQVAAVRVFDVRDAAAGDGAATTVCWLRDRLACSEREARQAVGLARSLDRLPLTAAALAAGEIAVTHARVLAAGTRLLDPGTVAAGEGFLLGWARRLDPARFATVVRRWVATVAPVEFERDTERRYTARWLSVGATFGGMTSVAGMLDPEGGAIVRAALDALVAATPPGDPRTRDQQRADALVDLVELARAHDTLPVTGGHRPEILVHLPATALTHRPGRPSGATSSGGPGRPGSGTGRGPAGSGGAAGPGGLGGVGGVATLADGNPLTAAALDRLACDARFRRLVLDPPAVPVELGRATRLIPPALRKHVALRDGGCRYPGCPRPAPYCEAHHVVYWRHGGETNASNLLLLCRYHHHLVHDNGHTMELHPDGTVRATRPDGHTLTSRPRGPTTTPV